MNNEIKTLDNGDFVVLYGTLEEMEKQLMKAMMIPAPLLKTEDCHFYNCNCSNCMDDLEKQIKDAELEKHLPGICEKDFSAPPGIADDMPDCPLCEAGVPLVGAQPQQHQNPPLRDPSDNDTIKDFMWGIFKLHNGKEYFLKKINDDGQREWTLHNTECKLWYRQSKAEQFIIDNIGEGQAGVRGFMVGG